ncbi:hypothetical protein BGX26_001768 [Mortierella sp. AD094]|nr:hypothetical protein BGX26_001768 [Mortierella sp. AD094]
MARWEAGMYDIILGVSAENLDLDNIESITFDIEGKRRVLEPTEIRALCLEKSLWDKEVVKWRLPLQVSKSAENAEDLKMLIMEIKTLDGSAPATFPRFLELHFMELRPFRSEGYPDDTYIRAHPPYIGSINVGHIDGVANGVSHGLPKKIIHFAVSGNGKYSATLSAANTDLLLELWDLQSVAPAPVHPQLCARIVISLAEVPTRSLEDSYNVSVSWDSSQIVLTDASKLFQTLEGDNQSLFAVYKRQEGSQPTTAGSYSSATTSDSTLPKDYQLLRGVDKIYGYGKFHIINAKDQNAENERFVACGGASVEVYEISPKWLHIRHIHLLQPCNAPSFGFSSVRRLIRTLRGKHFAWNDMREYADTVSVWDLETGRMTSLHWKKGYNPHLNRNDAIAFSRHDSVMAIGLQKVITTYCAKTGALLGSFRVPAYCKAVVDIAFICGDTHMLVIAEGDDSNGGGGIGLILDAASMAVMSRFALAYPCRLKQTETAFDDTLICALELSLEFVYLKHQLPHSQARPVCGDQCKSELASLDKQPKELKTPSGMHFKVEIQRNRGSCVIVSVPGNKELTLILPSSSTERGTVEYRCAVFLPDHSRLVVISDSIVTIWGLPTTPDDDYTLLLAWNRLISDNFWDSTCESWYTCAHGQVNASSKANGDENKQDKTSCCPRTERAFCREQPERFLHALYHLICIFAKGDKICKSAILRYVGSHINNYPDPDDRSKSVLASICMFWERNSRNEYEQFLKALLESPFGYWIPLLPRIENDRTKKCRTVNGRTEVNGAEMSLPEKDRTQEDRGSDPLYLLMQKAGGDKWAIGMAEVIVSYCIRQARTEKDTQFLSPVIQCLPWNSKGEASREHLNGGNFTQDLFVAPCEMLWQSNKNNNEEDDTSNLNSNFVMPKIRMFTRETIDNPAIAALIEYKWNTVGFKCWLLLFMYQCCFYLLVLVVVFIQIHSDQYRPHTGLYAVIAFGSVFFLSFEFVKVVGSKGRPSLYTWVALATFGLTLAASINQLVPKSDDTTEGEHSIGLFSFSVLFIFLNFLFGLRVIRSVCRFVEIIIQVIYEIRVFFIVFAGAILAFTIAITHLLRGCVSSSCQAPTTSFPSNFYRAISATYFFMGGRYDPINDEFDSNNWAFHTMMIVYFFFTVIIMLNVLIADIASYIPGYKRIYKRGFPKEIYYSATPQQIREYKKKYFEDVQEDSDTLDGSQDWLDYFPSSKASVTNAAAPASDDPPSSNENPVTSTAMLQAIMEGVSTMNREVIAQLKSMQQQQDQLRKQMERLELELKPSLSQPESSEQRVLEQEWPVTGVQCFIAQTAE